MLTRFDAQAGARSASEKHLWVLGGLPAPSAHALDRWIDALNALTREQWATVARESVDLALNAHDIERAIREAIEQHRLGVAVWFLRDAVETTVHYATHASGRASEFSPIEIARIHGATQWAAMALAVETWLDPLVCDAMIAPFELILPSVSPQLL